MFTVFNITRHYCIIIFRNLHYSTVYENTKPKN